MKSVVFEVVETDFGFNFFALKTFFVFYFEHDCKLRVFEVLAEIPKIISNKNVL